MRNLLCAILLAATQTAFADANKDTPWALVTTNDLDAAYKLVHQNHPAAHQEVGDLVFTATLDSAYKQAKLRSSGVTNAAGYRAVLKEFAVALGDPHIAATFKGMKADFHWPGFFMRYTNKAFVVDDHENIESAVSSNDKLVSCDGKSSDSLAAERLGVFRAIWSLNAERVRYAPFLLIDDKNPFLNRISECIFIRQDGNRYSHRLNWQPLTTEDFSSAYLRIQSRYGTQKTGVLIKQGVAWLAMPTMNESADILIAKVIKDRRLIFSASAIVVDLRGNGGGSSSKGDQLIDALFGRALSTRMTPTPKYPPNQPHWRATPFVLESITDFASTLQKSYGVNSSEAKEWLQEAELVRTAIANKEAFAPAILKTENNSSLGVNTSKKAPEISKRMVVLTDSVCVSSCLMLVARLRSLGIRHVGWETSASRRYMEVRSTQLPSGLSSFSTLQKVDFSSPNWIGPYKPSATPPASVTSEEELEIWVNATAKSL